MKMEEKHIEVSKLKEVASNFATGVTVVSITSSNGEVHGMTASSFLSVSLAPPLIMFSVMKENQMAKLLEIDMCLGVSILDEKMENLSNHFAKIHQLDKAPGFKFINQTPILAGAPAWYTTRVEKLIPAGDHYLVLCRVNDLSSNKELRPLIYFKGYKKLKEN